ncbi:YcaO-like family protein [Labrys monachus]|uniref:Ribosomal protein S12 methylthiotransferase accessory factor n=1 Tax=Labrys monachus TaxID=217067 RepID=A0ABU0FCG8_9HYPH|nr:YcaO-like family protein [Labrys monachus]MDQ0392308.1 ribosomal protein S12 methylthiotransferase accessory factor [Labrys monachus]
MALPSLHPIDLRAEAGTALLQAVSDQASPALAAVAARLARAFAVRSPFAPGLVCIGGEVVLDAAASLANRAPRLSVTGNGETAEAAFISCLGETADLLSQFERDGDIAAQGGPAGLPGSMADGWIGAGAIGAGRALDWMAGVEAASGDPVLLPADLCLRRDPARRVLAPAGALSAGVAAGPDRERAALRAILELCERDAAALWWFGGRAPRHFAADHPAGLAGRALVGRLRRGVEGRRTLLLDITADPGVPAVAALSMDGDGRGLACGVAARLAPEEAVAAAVLEMAQMELSAPIAAAKLAERGEAGLNEADRRHLRRAAFPAAGCPLLESAGLSNAAALFDGSSRTGALDRLVGHLRERGIRIFLVDLSRGDIGIAVLRAVSPDLQPYSRDVTAKRLETLRNMPGHGEFADGLPLF